MESETGLKLNPDKPIAFVIAPEHDMATESSHRAAMTAANYLRDKYNVILLEKDGATRSSLGKMINEHHPEIAIYFGHGEIYALFGQVPPGRTTPLLDEDNVNGLQESIVVAIACKSLDGLGNDAACIDVRAYLGARAYIFLPGPVEGYDYESDFIRTFMAPIIALANGETAEEAVEEFNKICKEYEDEYATKQPPEWKTMRNYLRANRLCFGLKGDASAVVFCRSCEA